MTKQLVTQLARLGDIIQSKRLVLSLKEKGEVSLLVDTSLVPLAKKIYPFAEILGISVHNPFNQQIWQDTLKLFSLLKTRKFDLVYTLNFTPISQQILNLFPCEILHGYSRENTYGRHSQWVKLAFRWMKDRRCTPLNLSDYWAYFSPLPIATSQVNPIATAKGGGLGVVVAGQNRRRSLHPKTYATIIQGHFQRLSEQGSDAKIYLLGTVNEQSIAHEIIHCLPKSLANHIKDCTGKTDFFALMDIVESLNLLLTPDTGIAHLAAHLGTPTEAFYFASANCFETGPYGQGHVVWQAEPSCAPCQESGLCPHEQSKNIKNPFENLPCHQVYKGSSFLMRQNLYPCSEEALTKNPLKNLKSYVSCVDDDFGLNWKINPNQIYTSELSIHMKNREALRQQLKNYCIAQGLYIGEVQNISDTPLFHVEDWVFPKR